MSSMDMASLDPDDARAPYAQVVAALRQEIELGILGPGVKLPTHQRLADSYGVSVGTVKRALGELQGAGLIVSRQGQGAFVRTRKSVLESVPSTFSPAILDGLWVTAYHFHSDQEPKPHADITRITPQSGRRLTSTNYLPEPRTQDHIPPFRTEVEAQLVNRHFIGFWKNVSDTRYFGSVHLAVLPGENVMTGYYTSFTSDVRVDAMAWTWVRLDPASVGPSGYPHVRLKDPGTVNDVLMKYTDRSPIAASAVLEESESE
jgi:DNA-binding transcriptional regulator YhcF (GntR family)